MHVRCLLSVTFVFILPFILHAQPDSIRYFNHYWNETTRDSAAYYRLAEMEGNRYQVRDYYISGRLQMDGTYSSLKQEIEEGNFTWYYENGQKFAEGNFVHGNRDDIWTFWFPDGLKKEEIKFFAERENELVIKWQSKRIKNSQHLLDKAVKQKKKGKPDKAMSLLNSILQINPFSAEAFYEKGLIECGSGNKEAGCPDLLKAREYGFYDTMELNKAVEMYCGN